MQFLFDDTTLTQSARATLERSLAEIKQHPIWLTGHTDSTGTSLYNQRLSEKRAQVIAEYLMTQGVSVNNIQIQGKGESKPVVGNSTAIERTQNRRVMIKFFKVYSITHLNYYPELG